jgi:hypothetical protein
MQAVTDPNQAARLLMSLRESSAGFVIMNRTFYALTEQLCAAWADEGKIYHDAETGSVLALGARFQADIALHIACMAGDLDRCLMFAEQQARLLGVPKLQSMLPPGHHFESKLPQQGFQADASDCIVMEVSLSQE